MRTGRGLHILFALTLAALFALAAWWIVFFNQAILVERHEKLRALEVQAARAAKRCEVTGASLEIVPKDKAQARSFSCHDRRERAIQPTSSALAAIDNKLGRRRLMVVGESTLLLVLLLVCTFMLYRMVRQGRRHSARMELFVSSVTHEMKTPLTGLKSMLQTFLSGRVPPNRAQELYAMGLKETERLEHMVENILLAGRLRADAFDLEMGAFDVRALLERFVEHRRGYLTDSDTRLELVCGGTILKALGDEKSVETILENLTDNALKYGGKAPQVTIEARQKERRVEIAVSDHGMGFDPKDLSRIFESFGRSPAAGRVALHGTGLGLSISAALARRMGGALVAHSDGSGKGSRFTLQLEAARNDDR